MSVVEALSRTGARARNNQASGLERIRMAQGLAVEVQKKGTSHGKLGTLLAQECQPHKDV